MALLKEDGSLDIERIKKLPLNEKKKEICSLSRAQYEEYISSLPINEGIMHTIAVKNSRTLDECFACGYVDAIERINNIGAKKYDN